ncbi:MAG TPA: bifunctional 2-polyprenyl-6-hydroxyphenol methylase/3-demethylubiquinol 3-O-methyltransferase UbiG [Acidiferrobacteraceae bacterium]|nr:bifunctional 2-polyprenyl-6-hydroxyphenol methylase/3-demethylubiquinol 3-O-methyltransferase UbiG [Acidiferrobacteraceae bacterium]
MPPNPQNVDHAEIAKFEALAARWWDQKSEFKPLHDINPLRLKFIDERTQLKGKTVLDVGCGGGILTEAMAQQGAQVTGIDMGEAPLGVARLHLHESGQSVNYEKCTAEDMAKRQPASFDVVTCMELLEHVPDPGSTIAACAQLVRPNGHVFFSTINRNPKSWLFAIVGAEYMLQLLPKGTHRYSNFVRPAELEADTRHSGLDMKEMTGMHYNPLLDHYSLGPGVDVNYIAYCTRPDE